MQDSPVTTDAVLAHAVVVAVAGALAEGCYTDTDHSTSVNPLKNVLVVKWGLDLMRL